MKKNYNGYFVTGTDTNIGKTIISTILVEKIKGVYWKPLQCGLNENGLKDSDIVKKILMLEKKRIFKEVYFFKDPISPNLASHNCNIRVSMNLLKSSVPNCKRPVIIEGAGGLLVPINKKELMIDLIVKINFPVIIVSSTKLGTINHTLLSIEALKKRNQKLHGIIFVGDENKKVIDTIFNFSKKIYKKSKVLGVIPYYKQLNKKNIKKAANLISI